MKLLRVCLALALLFAVAPICRAQFPDFSGGGGDAAPPVPAWDQFRLNPKVRLKLDFRNASVSAVAQILSTASGIPIIVDPSITKGISLQSPTPQSLDNAFALFNAELDLDNADLTKVNTFLEVKARGGSNRGSGNNFNPFGQGNPFGSRSGGGQSSVLTVYTLQYADATDLAKVINDVYTSTANANTGNPFAQFGGFGGGAAIAAVGGNGGGGGGFGRRGQGASNGVTGDTVKASADEFSNSLVVNAPQRDQDEISQIIQSIDKPATQPQQTSVFKLQYAVASDMQTIVQNLLTNSTSLGRGSTNATAQSRPQNNGGGGGGGFFGRFGGGGNNSANSANGTVSADSRTNALVVTTSSQLMSQVRAVVLNLDKPATYEGSTFIYVMKNARADVVANLFNESLGNRTTNGPTGGALTTTGVTQPTVTASTSSSATTGTVPSTIGTTGNNGGGNRNGGNNNQNSTSSTSNLETQGLDEFEHIVNVRNLTGQVLLVPNVDTNSIIVVAPPELWGIVKGVLQQLDQQPQQVMIDTLIVEATLDKTDQLGVEFNVNGNNIFGGLHGKSNFSDTGVGAPATSGFNYTLSAANYQAFVQAAETDTKLDVMSTPRIFTTNNATAQINISQSIPYITNQTSVATGTASNDLIATYSFLDVGIVLTVTPRIMSNGFVTMDVDQTANELQGYQSLGSSTEAPIVNQREAQTTVAVQDGQTIVLGGIIQDQISDTTNKIPLLGDLPILGPLFKSDNKTNTKTELLVFLTPHIIKSATDAQALKDETESEIGKEAKNLIPKAPPAPRSTGSPASTDVPQVTTTVTVTPNINDGSSTPTSTTTEQVITPPAPVMPDTATSPSTSTAQPNASTAPTQ